MKIKNKKKINPLYIIGGVVVLGAAAFVLWKKGIFAKIFKKKQA